MDHQPIPLIDVGETILISIRASLTDRVVRTLRDDVAEALRRREVRALVLDVSSVDTMDSFITRCLRDIAISAHLMGSETIVCGLRPDVVTTLVEMGMDLERVRTALHMEHALQMLHARDHAPEKRARPAKRPDPRRAEPTDRRRKRW